MAGSDDAVDTHKIVCKPFRETGYCGYGDSCKYSHDRSGWADEATAAGDGSLCAICRSAFDERVVTECGHSFCSMCAIRRYQEVDECAVCGKAVHGRFWVG